MSKAIEALFEASLLMKFEDKLVPMAVYSTFLGVALWENHKDQDGNPMTLEALAQRVGVVATTMSQYTRYLGDYYRLGKPGLGLVETDIYHENRRKKTFNLTPEGRALIAKLEVTIKKAI